MDEVSRRLISKDLTEEDADEREEVEQYFFRCRIYTVLYERIKYKCEIEIGLRHVEGIGMNRLPEIFFE